MIEKKRAGGGEKKGSVPYLVKSSGLLLLTEIRFNSVTWNNKS